MEKKIEKRKIVDLKPHPLQSANFADLSHSAIAELAENIRANGLLQPAEILPDGTILCGHQRLAACKLLGWTEIDVWVRDDLAKLGEAACEMRLIEDNLQRRQLSPLAKARCYARRVELERSTKTGKRRGIGLRDVIGRELGCSGRNAERYVRVLSAPLEVQHALDCGDISLVNAGRVGGLPCNIQQDIADKIRSGRPAKQVVADALKTPHVVRPMSVREAFDELTVALYRHGPLVREQMSGITFIFSSDYRLLCESRDLMDRLIQYAERLAVENKMSLVA